jgi:hypothetical protein
MPQEICAQWVRRRDGGWRRVQGDGICQFRDHFHVQAVVAIAEYGPAGWGNSLADWIEEEEGTKIREMDEAEELQWWARKIQWGGM